MAKLGFTKLGIKLNNEVKTIKFNDCTIEIKQYLPIDDKLSLITNVLELSHDQNNFSNPIKVDVYMALEIIERYTNIVFTPKQKENPVKLYDLIINSGLYNLILDNIPKEELDSLTTGTYRTIESVYKYQNSALGILEAIAQDYSQLDFDATEIQKKLADAENIELLQSIMTKLG